MPASDDLALITAYLDGDAGAFDLLFQRYHARVRAVCLRYVGDDTVAEDLVQETFFRVIRALKRVDQSFNFGAWLHRIAVNICQDELRRRNRRAVHLDQRGGDTEEAMLKVADRDRSGHPEDALETNYAEMAFLMTRGRRTADDQREAVAHLESCALCREAYPIVVVDVDAQRAVVLA